MKFLKVAVFVLVTVCVLPALQASERAQSAKRALKTLAKLRGAEFLTRVVMVEGRFGTPQPQAWRILTLNPEVQGRMHEFMINGNKVDSERSLLAWKSSPLVPLRDVKVDSSDAFLKADLSAKDAKIGFDSLDYQLIMPAQSNEPLWIVSLIGKSGDSVGEMQIGAKSGSVRRKAWVMPSVSSSVPVQAEANESPSSKPNARTQAPRMARVRQAGGSLRFRSQASVRVQDAPGLRSPELSQSIVTESEAIKVRTTADKGNGGSLKKASGQVLENARQGILRTGGSLRDFFRGTAGEERE